MLLFHDVISCSYFIISASPCYLSFICFSQNFCCYIIDAAFYCLSLKWLSFIDYLSHYSLCHFINVSLSLSDFCLTVFHMTVFLTTVFAISSTGLFHCMSSDLISFTWLSFPFHQYWYLIVSLFTWLSFTWQSSTRLSLLLHQ